EKVEVVIADGMSEDNTRKVIEEYSYSHNDLDIRIINNIKKNIPSGLNEAITESTGEIIVRMDAHSIPSENYIERAVANLQAQKGDNIGGRWIILPGADRWISRSIAIAASHPLAVGGVSYRIGGSAQAVDTVPFGSFRRELFDQIGLFDENLLSNEDYDFNTRIRKNGGTVWFDPEMKTKYFARSTLGQLAKQYWRYGYWKFKMLKKYPDSLRLRQGIPPLFILSLVILAIISFFYPIFGI
ncbi:MAG: glycosyltransferase, partial [Aliifodinibius sp.]|nr:glycosyltransferase family 2 protein [candidate division Zixibacteria bacterium]NIT60593.1 glycosyltransferase family 2 protein [Fodinibius sp.]NIR66735.1 glycosyltransferase family 2 protein [candidate division Zixibacteria bacterium]NIS48279.1 glycosyltransferase family 2 protein [candidate division Zixibacteria bacterium]NIU16397.1 glycosyltransferase family 2 protein [candidate division Zixibacteria bacterium]